MDKGTLAKMAQVQADGEVTSPYYIPFEHVGKLDPNFFCRGWNSKRNKYCRARSGAGTDHPGQGRCRNHGGMSAITHGRYSDVNRGSIAEHHDQFDLETETEKLDILPEATQMRSLAAHYLENYEEFFQGVLRFNQMEDEEAKAEKRSPRFIRPPSLETASGLLKDAAEVVDRVHKQRSNSAVSLKTFFRLMGLMSDVVIKNVKSLERKLKLTAEEAEIVAQVLVDIADEWQELKVAKL